jgi:hypothetical protein
VIAYFQDPHEETAEHRFHLAPKHVLRFRFDGALRQVRPAAAAARLSGLQGSLRGLPRSTTSAFRNLEALGL